jgi:Cdc6-like AAA superfamily ATPase
MVIMLSNTPHVVKQLDAATLSSLQPLRLYFRNYDAQQLGEILLGRANRGLKGWDDSHIAQIPS